MAEQHRDTAGLDAWAAVADELEWHDPWTTLYTPKGRYGRWFDGGRFNLAVNCVDRHLRTRGSQPVILWEGEPGDRRELTYEQLHAEVVALAGSLRGLGVEAGDRVALHMGWLPETVVAMLACARIGAVVAILPTPLPAEALALRLQDFQPRVLFTQDGAWRHGTILPLKARADEALGAVGGVEHTVVVRRTGMDVAWYEGDRWLHDLVAEPRPSGPERDTTPAALDPEHPILAGHLANRRGQPVSILHGAANLAASSLAIHRYAVAEGGVFWCAGDVSWIGAQAHGVLGPLLAGTTTVMFEGMLDVPTRHRTWDIVSRYGVSTLVTTPTVIRLLRGWSQRPPDPETVATLRRVVMIAEPSGPELVKWLADEVGDGRITVGDGWGQVQLGGIVSVEPPLDPKSLPDPGFAIVADDGTELPDGQGGELVMRQPWAGTLRAMEGSGVDDVMRNYHWHREGVYSTYDVARRCQDGTLEFLGRMDEVVSISGQLVSLGEVRQVLLEHPFVVAAEVFERADARLGRSLAAAVELTEDVPADATAAGELLDTVRELLGGLARPRALAFIDRFGDQLTRSQLREALTLLLAGAGEEPAHLTWKQILAASVATKE
ncbi:AMP-binding protein [Phytoactinopolyspora mesophila]|uniref:acetate--CoA ligase n=1 Tax=Phytoactinopolyspora mesophila TaxID=2650750 RepID=A0A7K3M710_9ACTN|nr:AMP-binding protein [Phytoactinopolyspora mesophila]NDL59109.1 AMP-binding protein [Phytoactinopolyspora mesophila]